MAFRDLIVKIGADTSNLTAGLDSSAASLGTFGKAAIAAGAVAVAALVAIGAKAIGAATEMNEAMAGIATLVPDNAARIDDLKRSIQDMAIETGKSTADLADGMFQVISAFGDSAESAKLLDINARAAAAGMATTTDAINLTSAVTKGFGDTSAEAIQKVADLAFKTNELGNHIPRTGSGHGQRRSPFSCSQGEPRRVVRRHGDGYRRDW